MLAKYGRRASVIPVAWPGGNGRFRGGKRLALLVLCGAVRLATLLPVPEAEAAATFEPPAGQAYFGFTFGALNDPHLADPNRGDIRPFAERLQDAIQVELGGKSPTLVGFPTVWQRPDGTPLDFADDALLQIRQFENFNGMTVVPFINWKAMTGYVAQNYAGITTKTIVAGALDDYIRRYARDIKAYGKPIFIRPICEEFHVGGQLSPQCSPQVNPTLTPQDFVNAWRRVVDIFRQEGVTNVAWVWTPVTLVPPPFDRFINIDPHFESYYPGDDYVDWAGADHYDDGPPSLLDPLVNFAVAHNKPFFLAEWGVRSAFSTLTPAGQEQWLHAMFDYFESHLQIKAVVYSNNNGNFFHLDSDLSQHVFLYNNQVNYRPNVNDNDYRLLAESGANFRGTFASRISHPRYLSALAPQLSLRLNATDFHTGSPLRVGLRAQNPGAARAADFYLGFVTPDQGAICFITRLSPPEGTCIPLTTALQPQRFPAVGASIQLPQGLDVTLSNLFIYTLSGSELQGTYMVFTALTLAGALSDDRIDPADLLAIDIQSFTFSP